jgi:peptidyl-prolyl cis-trans isomerase B (cyclophilin B)
VRILIILVVLLLFTPVSKAESSPMVESFEGNPIVVINLTYEAGTGGGSDFEGEIVLELFLNWAPITVENFVSLVEQGFYDGIFFHRIIDDFVIQSGDPTCKEVVAYPGTDPTCGDNGSDDNIPFESNENLTHINGAIGMARGLDPDSATSQFYICDTPQHGLDNGNRTQEDDPGYAVFGVVREGLDLVQLAAGVPTTNDVDGDGSTPRAPGGPDRPLYEVHINSITLREYVTIPVVEKEEEGLPSFNLNLAILSMVLVSILRRN